MALANAGLWNWNGGRSVSVASALIELYSRGRIAKRTKVELRIQSCVNDAKKRKWAGGCKIMHEKMRPQ